MFPVHYTCNMYAGSAFASGLKEKEYQEPWVCKNVKFMGPNDYAWLLVPVTISFSCSCVCGYLLLLLDAAAGLLQLLSCNSSCEEAIFRKSRYVWRHILKYIKLKIRATYQSNTMSYTDHRMLLALLFT